MCIRDRDSPEQSTDRKRQELNSSTDCVYDSCFIRGNIARNSLFVGIAPEDIIERNGMAVPSDIISIRLDTIIRNKSIINFFLSGALR